MRWFLTASKASAAAAGRAASTDPPRLPFSYLETIGKPKKVARKGGREGQRCPNRTESLRGSPRAPASQPHTTIIVGKPKKVARKGGREGQRCPNRTESLRGSRGREPQVLIHRDFHSHTSKPKKGEPHKVNRKGGREGQRCPNRTEPPPRQPASASEPATNLWTDSKACLCYQSIDPIE
jgi:hypothetical protein